MKGESFDKMLDGVKAFESAQRQPASLTPVKPAPGCDGYSVCFTTHPAQYGVMGCTCGQCPK